MSGQILNGIRARYERDEAKRLQALADETVLWGSQAAEQSHRDRGVLLAILGGIVGGIAKVGTQ